MINGLMSASVSALTIAAAFASTPSFVQAQTLGPPSSPSDTGSGVAEVIVTAGRRSEIAQHVPSSITALTQTFLKESGAKQFEDIVHAVPALAYTENSTGQAVLAIRGIQTSAAFSNFQSPVALYYDEVPVLDPFIPWEVPQLELFDVNRVEVLEGPQGTLFGAGALSGAVRIITNKPNLNRYDAATEDTVETTNGGSASYLTNVMVNLPIVDDKLAIRAVGYYNALGGWIDNSTTHDKNTNNAKVYGGRAEIEWAATDKLNFVGTIANEITQPHDSNYEPYESGRDYVSTNTLSNYNNDNTTIYNLVGTYSMPWSTLTSSASYIDRTAFSQFDFTGTASAVTGLNAASPLLDRFNTGDFLEEVRLASTVEHPYKWLIGAIVQNYHFGIRESITQPGVSGLGYPTDYLEAADIKAKIVDQAIFGEGSYDITPKLTFTLGARYAHFSVAEVNGHAVYGTDAFEGPPSSITRPATYDKLTPKVSLSYNYTPSFMVYVLADEGYREGHSNLTVSKDPLTGQPIPPTYGPDELWNYEAGTKASFFERRLVLDAAAYYIDWSKVILQEVTGGGSPYVGNAGTAHVKGVELQLTAKPIEALELGTSLSYNNAKLVSVLPGVSATVGDQLPGSAKFNSYLYGQYTYKLSNVFDLSMRIDYSYTGREYAYLQNYHNPSALHYGDYSSIGAQLGLSYGRYEFQLFVRNLADLEGRIAARTLFPGAQEVLQVPRVIGLTFRAHL